MSLWRRIRGELAGAWRSVRYDLGRRPPEHPGGPEVTSTGLTTFPGSLMEWRTAEPVTDARPTRRFLAVAALCLLALAGAIGSYLLVARGLPAASQDPVAGAPLPPPPSPAAAASPASRAAASPAAARTRAGVPAARMGAAARPHRGARPGPPPGTGSAAPARSAGPVPVTERPAVRRPPAATPECHCVTPPVPTPTVPASSGTERPDPGDSPAAGPSAPASTSTQPSPDTSGADPGDDRRHRHRHR